MIPADKILENQYTRGNEFIDSTGKDYRGYYCIVTGNKYYTGKVYDNNSKPLSPVLITTPPAKPTSLPPQNTFTRYFLKKTNEFPMSIKEVDEPTYIAYKDNFFYQSVAVAVPGSDFGASNKALDEAETQMPGLKIFLSV
jgi:hypothetical protein